ncbi:MAG: type II/IV secretion system protein [Desulfobacterales bacterium]|nr:type II/IV secretion system protein [Desulfobacterales bacterium]
MSDSEYKIFDKKKTQDPSDNKVFLKEKKNEPTKNTLSEKTKKALTEEEKSLINKEIKEAEFYVHHGLNNEALELYEKILKDYNDISTELIDDIKVKIGQLKTKIKDLDDDSQELTAEDVSWLKEGWTGEESASEIFDSALAFKELGLFKEAVDEFTKIINSDYPSIKVIPELAKCLFEVHPPALVINKIEEIIKGKELSDKDMADIKYTLGLEMEKRNYKDLASEIYVSVKEIDPAYDQIESKIESTQPNRNYDSRYAYLLKNNKVSVEQLQKALAQSKKVSQSVEFCLMQMFKVQKEDILQSLSLFYKCSYRIFLPDIPVPFELIKNLKKPFLLQNNWVPLSWEISEGSVEVVIDDPGDLIKTDNIYSLMKVKKIKFSVGIKEDIESIISHFFQADSTPAKVEVEEADDDVADIEFDEEKEIDEVGQEENEASGKVVRFVDQVLVSAYRKNVSDIHFEPSVLTKKMLIRFRIDGVCQEFKKVPLSLARGLLSRIKIMSGLDIAEKRMPQDGKIKFKRKGIPPFELRVATLPTSGGYEDSVLRILAAAGAMPLDDMGLSERNANVLKKIISSPYGLILVVGPTGSGKTTSLHAALGHINKPGVKIWTAEDPVEITQEGLRQVQAQPKIGLDFARIMRAFLRADPDVIMIGEMRDHETAAIGIEASLTGHLVFSTLHTNSAPETITRLLDMKLNPLNFSDAFLGVLAQRLARRLCKGCKESYLPTQEEFDDLVYHYGEEHFERTGVTFPMSEEKPIYRAKKGGCDICSNTGYKGRLGVHELLEGTTDVKRLIKRAAPTEEIFKQGIIEGMATLKQDGIHKLFNGMTDFVEIKRVCM